MVDNRHIENQKNYATLIIFISTTSTVREHVMGVHRV